MSNEPPYRLYLLLGANLGNRQQTFTAARQSIIERIGLLRSQSGLYETAAWGVTDQPAYLNQVLIVETYLEPAAVLAHTQAIEQQLGRVRAKKWGARVIDIDLLFYEDLIIKSSTLTLPHPLLHLRRFTLAPLAEISPNLIHPVLKQPIWSLLADCPDESEVIKFS